MTTTTATPFRRFENLYFADAQRTRPGHVLLIGERLSYAGTSARAFELSGDSFSTYRMSVGTTGSPVTSVAIEIEITGRVVQHWAGCEYLRARITFVGDGEPNTTARGWVEV